MSEWNPIPPAQRSAGIVLADPVLAAAAEAYALGNGGNVIPFMGFKFVVCAPEERTLWKLRLIGRLEHERKVREAGK